MSKKNEKTQASVPAGFGSDDLEQVRSGVQLQGFYTPRQEEMTADGDHIYGTLIRYVERKNAPRNKAEGFIILLLAHPVKGLLFGEDRDDGVEGTLETGMAIGIDIRQSYNMLKDKDYEGRKVHLHFKSIIELSDGRSFWDVDVSVGKPATTALPTQGQSGGDDIPF